MCACACTCVVPYLLRRIQDFVSLFLCFQVVPGEIRGLPQRKEGLHTLHLIARSNGWSSEVTVHVAFLIMERNSLRRFYSKTIEHEGKSCVMG